MSAAVAVSRAAVTVPRSHLGHAVYVWSILQPRQRSVADAAETFSVPIETVLAAIAEHPRLVLYGDTDRPGLLVIEHEGE